MYTSTFLCDYSAHAAIKKIKETYHNICVMCRNVVYELLKLKVFPAFLSLSL